MKGRGSKTIIATALGLCVSALLFSASAKTHNKFGGAGIGFRAGFVDPGPTDGTIGFGAHALFEWDYDFAGQVQYYPNIDYWSKDQPGTRDTTTYTQVLVSPLEFNYQIPVDRDFPFQTYIGAGIGYALTIEDYSPEERDDLKDHGIMANIYGGIKMKTLKVFVPFLELRLSVAERSAVKLMAGLTIRSWKNR